MEPQEQTPPDRCPSVSSSSSDRRIPTLDGWRAIAIALVLFNHIGMVLTRSDAPSLLYAGSMGVSLFFGLSGLLITTLLLQEWDRDDRIDWRAFYERRLFRIVPAYLAFLLAVTLAGGWQSGWEALATVFFARNYLPKNLASPLTGHLWSLAVEMHFYLLWPLILRWAGRRRPPLPPISRLPASDGGM